MNKILWRLLNLFTYSIVIFVLLFWITYFFSVMFFDQVNLKVLFLSVYLFSLLVSSSFFFSIYPEELKKTQLSLSKYYPTTISTKFFILKHIEPLRKIIFYIYNKFNFRFYLHPVFVNYIIDLSYVGLLILLFMIFLSTFTPEPYSYILASKFFFYGIDVEIDTKILVFTFLAIVLLSSLFHEMFHILFSKFTNKERKSLFISAGVGLYGLFPVMYVIRSKEDLKEEIDNTQLLIGGVMFHIFAIFFSLVSLIFLPIYDHPYLLFILVMTIFVNYSLLFTNLFPLLKNVDGYFLSKMFNIRRYELLGNNIVSGLMQIGLLLVTLYGLFKISTKIGVILILLLFIYIFNLAIFFFINSRSKRIDLKSSDIIKIEDKNLIDEFFDRLRFELLSNKVQDKNFTFDFDKKIISHPLIKQKENKIIIFQLKGYQWYTLSFIVTLLFLILSIFIIMKGDYLTFLGLLGIYLVVEILISFKAPYYDNFYLKVLNSLENMGKRKITIITSKT